MLNQTTTRTFLTFETTGQTLSRNGSFLLSSFDTGDLFFVGPLNVEEKIELGGKFLGVDTEAFLNLEFGLLAYADLGSPGTYDASIDISLNTKHSAIVSNNTVGGVDLSEIVFDFSDYTVLESTLDTTAFSAGLAAGIDLIIDTDFGFRGLTGRAFFEPFDFGDVTFADIDERLPLISLESSLEDEFGPLSIELTAPTGANTSGIANGFGSSGLLVTSSGTAAEPFLKIEADVDDVITTLLGEIKIPKLQAVVEVLENTIFGEFEFELSNLGRFIPSGVFSAEGAVVDLTATVGTSISEDLELNFDDPSVAGDQPDVTVVLLSDNGTPDILLDDKMTTAKLGDTNVTLDIPEYAGFGNVSIEATYTLGAAKLSHSMGIDIVGDFTIDLLRLETGGRIGELIPDLEATTFQFPEGGFRGTLIDSFYDDTFDVTGFNQVSETYDVFYASDLPASGVDLDDPSVVQELISFLELLEVNRAASRTLFTPLTDNRVEAVINSNFVADDPNEAEFLLWTGDTLEQADILVDLGPGQLFVDRDVVIVDAGNATYGEDPNTNPTIRGRILDSNSGVTTAFGGEVLLQEDLEAFLPKIFTQSLLNSQDALVTARVEYVKNGADEFAEVTAGNSLNYNGAGGNDLLLYIGDEALFFDGGGNTNSETGDVFVASFAASHPLDSVSWDLRPNAVGQSGLDIDLALTRGQTDADRVLRIEGDDLTSTTGTVTTVGSDIDMSGSSTASVLTPLDEGVYTARIHLTGELTGASTITFESGDPNGSGLIERGTFDTSADNPGSASLERILIVRDIEIGATVESIKLSLDSAFETIRVDRIDFFEQSNVTLRNIESAALQLGDNSDTIVTSDTTDVILMGDGADRLVITADEISEVFLDLQAGNDVAIYELQDEAGLGNPSGTEVFDFVYGGTGGDEVLIQNLSASGARWAVQTGPGSPATVFGAASSSDDLESTLLADAMALCTAAGFGTGSTDRTTADAFSDPNVSVQTESGSGFLVGAHFFDFEAFSFEGSDTANDLAVFTGGALYRGGASLQDTLVADFSQFALPAGQEKGIVLSGFNPNGGSATSPFQSGQTIFNYTSPFAFADGQTERTSVIEGFERLIVTGTTKDDFLIGGEFLGDVLRGDEGNDILVSGGGAVGAAASPFDLLYGGDDDDIFYVDGTELAGVFGGNDDDLIILTPGDIEAVAVTEGLTVTGLVQNVDITGTGQVDFDVDSTASDLFNAIDNVAAGAFSVYTYTDAEDRGLIVFDIEAINLTGLDSADDLLIYRGGATYEAGESTNDRDVFAADFSAQNSGIAWDLEADVDGTRLGNSIFVSGIDRAVLKLGSSIDSVTGGALDDHIEGNGGGDFLRGGGSVIEDVLYGGEGGDFFGWNANEGRAVIDGGSDAGDTTGSVVDRLLVSSIGDDGNLQAGLTAGLGFGINTSPNTGTSFSSLISTSSITALTTAMVQLDTANAAFRITSGAGNEVEFVNIEATDVRGSNEMDDVIAVQGGALYDGGDRVGDKDILIADLSDEVVNLRAAARSGDDRGDLESTFSDLGNGTTIGNFERFFITGGNGDDSFIGGDFTDLLRGGDGSDILDGGAGNDTIDGGFGDDLLFYTGGLDSVIGGLGTDFLELGELTGGYEGIVGMQSGGSGLFSLGGGLDGTVLLRRSDLNQTSDIQSLVPALFDPNIIAFGLHGKGGFDSLATFTGTDFVQFRDGGFDGIEAIVISADDDDDLLISGGGGGTLSGDGGDDVLIGRAGNDLLIGGDGTDSYVLSGNWGSDVIGGEYSGTGNIVFLGLNRADVTFSAGGDDLFADDSSTGATLVFLDYFAGGGNGLNYTFAFDDQTSTLNLSTLPNINPTGAITVGTTYFGTADRDEMIDSTTGADSYFARAGNDIILGSLGPDIISGGLGADTVSYALSVTSPGTPGVTVDLSGLINTGGDAEGDLLISIENLLGSTGDDFLFGDAKQNALAGNTGNDLISGGSGNDALSGDAGDDTLDGGNDDDSLFGGSGNDTLEGDGGDDYLLAGEGNDSIEGGIGNDTAIGDAGDDSAALGDGDDIYMITNVETVTGIDVAGTDSVDGGADSDTIDLSAFDASVVIDLSAQQVTSTGQNATTGVGALTVLANLSGFENAVGSSFDDILLGDGFANKLAGDSGNDTLVGFGGNDLLLGNGGFDTVDYSGAGAAGASVFVDLAGEFATDGLGGTDTLRGIEHVIGSNGAFDDLFGDENNNTFTGGAGISIDVINGLDGSDTVDYSVETGTSGVTVNLAVPGTTLSPNATDTHGHGDALISIENVIGTTFNDTFTGTAGNNTFVGGAGDDQIDGGDGFDVVDYSAERDAPDVGLIFGVPGPGQNTDRFGDTDTLLNIEAIIGTDFDDMITSGLGKVQEIHGGAGNDTIGNTAQTSGVGSTLFGGSGADLLFGTNDGDLLFGGIGNDTVFGNGGEDTYFYVDGFDQYTANPSARSDVNFSLFGSAVAVDLGTQSVETSDTLDANTGTLRQIMVMGSVNGVTGGAANDSLTGSTGNDFISGGEGNDTISGGDGSDLIDGGAGLDLVVFSPGTGGITVDTGLVSQNVTDAFGNVETVINVEHFVGTAASDTFIGGAGNDTFTGGDGFDTYDGGDGIDVLDLSLETGAFDTSVIMSLNPATGVITGIVTDSFLNFELFTNIEVVIGSNGVFDDLLGTVGNDTFTGNAGSNVDRIDGSDGVDTIDYSQEKGGSGIVVNLSFAGTTTAPSAIDTYGDFDALSNIENAIGTDQDDVFTGSALDNTLQGGAGNDLFFGFGGDDLLIGDAGHDIADYQAVSGPSGISVALTRASGQVTDSNGGIDTLRGIEEIYGTDMSDTMVGDGSGNTLKGASGNDTLDGLDGDDMLEGGLGDDLLAGFNGSDHLTGGQGNDSLMGEDGIDTLEGGQGADTIDGGVGVDAASYEASAAGVDVTIGGSASGGDAAGDMLIDIEDLIGSALGDTLTGDAGQNVLSGKAGDDTLMGGDDADTLEGGAGSDTLDGGAGVEDVVSYATSAIGVRVDLTANTVTDGDAAGDIISGFEGFIGSGGDDFASGTAGINSLNGGGGNDTINGLSGDDRIFGGEGDNILRGQGGRDFITASSGNDTLTGGQNEDNLFGEAGADLLQGQGGADVIFAGAGDDSVQGGAQNDLLHGDDGNDTILGQGSDDTLTGGEGDDSLSGGSGNDRLDGGDGDDRLEGQGNNDLMFGGDGNDFLRGAAGQDSLFGGNGDDTLFGGNGGDMMDGGAGDDLLNAGAQADVFCFTVGSENDEVRGFGDNQDTLELSAALVGGLTDIQQILDTFAVEVGGGVNFDFQNGTDFLRVTAITEAALLDDISIV